MKDLRPKRGRVMPLLAFSGLVLVVGPTVASLGIDAAAYAPALLEADGPESDQVVYLVVLSRKDATGDSASGTIRLKDHAQSQIRVGKVLLSVKPLRDGRNWNLAFQAYDEGDEGGQGNARIIWEGGTVMPDDGSSHVETKLAARAAGDVSGLSVSLWARVSAKPKSQAAFLLAAGGDRVYLNFKEPTEIKDLIKTVAQLTGKNVVLGRDVRGKITMDDPRPVTKEEAYQAFLQALHLLDLDVIETGRVIKIINKSKAG